MANPQRIEAFIAYQFQEEANAGRAYLSSDELVGRVLDNIPGTNVSSVIKIFNESDKFSTIYDEQGNKRLVLDKVLKKERNVADIIYELCTSEVNPLNDVEATIRRTETINGFKFSDEQKEAIYGMVNNRIFMLQGYAGTGKTASVTAFTNILKHNGIQFVQCCISGKAADNLRKTTGYDARTIASIVVAGDVGRYDCIIIDEISMVDLDNFEELLKGLKPNARVIMMGDSAQLDSIGIGVMIGLIKSNKVPSITLDKIHRQAEESAIITHSMSIRQGKRPKELGNSIDTFMAYGAKKDLIYYFVDDDDEDSILNVALKLYKRTILSEKIDDVLILCQTKKTGKTSVSKINSFAQKIANPHKEGEVVFPIINKDNEELEFRVGDRVMNLVNETKAVDPPIFNGNTGTIISMAPDLSSILIDFDGIGEVEVPNKLIKNLTLGYCATMHKTQGMTLKSTILALPFHYMLNSKELLYTGITRASKRAVVITSKKSFKRLLSVSSKKIARENLSLLIKERFEDGSVL